MRQGMSEYCRASSTTRTRVRSTRCRSASRRRNRGTTLVSSHRQRSSNRVILGTVRFLTAVVSPPVNEYAGNDVTYLTCWRRPRTSKLVVAPIEIIRANEPDRRSKKAAPRTTAHAAGERGCRSRSGRRPPDVKPVANSRPSGRHDPGRSSRMRRAVRRTRGAGLTAPVAHVRRRLRRGWRGRRGGPEDVLEDRVVDLAHPVRVLRQQPPAAQAARQIHIALPSASRRKGKSTSRAWCDAIAAMPAHLKQVGCCV